MEALLGAEVVALECEPSLSFAADLFPAEAQLVEAAVDRRRAQFATARVLARRALEELGVSPRSLCPNPDGSPRWPEGYIGTITHTLDYCAVAVAPAWVGAIGLDAESAESLREHLVEEICTDEEIRWLDSHSNVERGHRAKLIFSAKEAFYKCQYPLTSTYLDFLDVELHFDEDKSEFRVSVLRNLSSSHSAVSEARGKYLVTVDRIVTAARLNL